jgi:heme/copper-type cytochrome/quinol oxidase subunit 4
MLELISKAKAITFDGSSSTVEPIEGVDFLDIAGNVVTWVLVLAGILAVVYLIYGGIMYITAGGEAEKATKGRTAVINAVIGIIIILLAVVIVRWVMGIVQSGAATG